MAMKGIRRGLAALALTSHVLAAIAADITVAQVAPFSGPLAPTGTHIRAGAQLCFDAVNAAGGIHGARIRLVSKDDGYQAPQTVRLARELLKEQQPVALLGVVGTGNVEALLKDHVLDQAGTPLVGIRSGAASLAGSGDPWLFLTRATYADEIAKILDQYVPLGYKRVAVLYQDDPFGQDGLKAAEQQLGKAGGTLVAKAGYAKNTTAVEGAVAAIAAANPNLVILVANTAASAEFVRRFRATGNPAQLVALSTTDAGQVVTKVGKGDAHGLAITQVVPDPASPSAALVKEMREAWKKFAPRDVSFNHTLVEGYLGARVLVEGLRRAGPGATPKKLRDALEGIRELDVGGMLVSFSPTRHAGSRYVDITIINRDGVLMR